MEGETWSSWKKMKVYSLELHKRYIEFTVKLTRQLERENQILADYPADYLDEDTTETYQK